MILQYVGSSTVRLVEVYRFYQGSVHDVLELNLIQEMLTQPGIDFVVAPSDPLAQLVGADRAAELALDGITTPEAWEASQQMTGQRPADPALATPDTRMKFFREEVGHRTEML